MTEQPSDPRRDARSSLSFSALQLVARPRAVRKLVVALSLVFALAVAGLVTLPWQQNIPATGSVTALDPLDRRQVIPAPVTGRLVKVYVQEGALVEAGEILAEMADQDPQYALRLEQQLRFAQQKVQAASDTVDFYSQQLLHLEDSLDLAVKGAEFAQNVASEEVKAKQQDLAAAQADLEQKKIDRDRRWRLFQKKIGSALEFQKAEADYLASVAKVEAAKAKVSQALSDEQAKRAKVGQTREDMEAKINSTKSLREDARSKLALAQKELTEALTKLERQKTQRITAPRRGRVFRVRAASSADLVLRGDPVLELIPDTDNLAVALWVRGNDAPLVSPNRKVRLQFEGWPAVQFAGWPSVAVGTFGGIVEIVDAQDDGAGRFRILVRPDPDDQPWPDRRYLRQGVRAAGWVLLDEVGLGYELWRQLNAFPPSVDAPPADQNVGQEGDEKKKTGSKQK